ncbi:MAG: hypothetical protein ACRDFB_03725 [Rhabdochlamydiaceae bacterium]
MSNHPKFPNNAATSPEIKIYFTTTNLMWFIYGNQYILYNDIRDNGYQNFYQDFVKMKLLPT